MNIDVQFYGAHLNPSLYGLSSSFSNGAFGDGGLRYTQRRKLRRQMAKQEHRQYGSGTLDKGLDVLETLERATEPLRILDLANLTKLDRAAVFRLLCTLENRGYVERLEDKRYSVKNRKRAARVFYIAPLAGNSFRVDVTASLKAAALKHGIHLEMIDTTDTEIPRDQVNEAIRSAADAVILFQRRGSLAHVLADRFLQEQIPVISVETPIAGALYFGGNSYRAGLMAGEALGVYAQKHWKGDFDRLLLIESSLSAVENMARLTGTVEGVNSIVGQVPPEKIIHVDGLASLEASREACLRALKSLPHKSRVLISCFNDPSAIGALAAVNESGRAATAAIVGQNGTEESRSELARRSSALIASIAYFPERYGEQLMKIADSVIAHQKTPLAVYVDHVLLNRNNLKKLYPPTR
jgi:ribose transport system substrate-binding protein